MSKEVVLRALILSITVAFLSSSGAFSAQSQSAQPQGKYFGQLDRELLVDNADYGLMGFKATTSEERKKLPLPLSEGDQIFAAKLEWFRAKQGNTVMVKSVALMLVEPAGEEAPFMYADLDGNDVFAAGERFVFAPSQAPSMSKEVLLKVPLPEGSLFKYFPARIGYAGGDMERRLPRGAGRRTLFSTIGAYTRGWIDIKGRRTLAQYSVDPQTGNVDFPGGFVGVDSNGDGTIDRNKLSPESNFFYEKGGEAAVFRAGDRYLSTEKIDSTTGRIILSERLRSDYHRIEVRVGSPLPDFSFADLTGRMRKLSDFRGKYLLLDMWGSWCGPCVAEIPNLLKAYKQYRERGFEILGLDNEENSANNPEEMKKALDKIQSFVGERGITWPQASTASPKTGENIKNLMDMGFGLDASGYPTEVMLDPQGKVISVGGGELPLRGKDLLATLEKLMPSAESKVEYYGQLEPEMEILRLEAYRWQAFRTAKENELKGLPLPLREGDKASVAEAMMSGNWINLANLSMMLIEPAAGEPYVYADVDRNGSFSANERFPIVASQHRLEKQRKGKSKVVFDKEAVIRIPLPGGSFVKFFPFILVYADNWREWGYNWELVPAPVARGQVEINGRKTLVYYPVDPKTGRVRDNGFLGIDGDGDRKINATVGGYSPEFRFAGEDEPLVFRMGDRYVSTKAVDSVTGRIVLREHPASDYSSISWQTGEVFPDFSFSDLDAKGRKLSDFRGKWVLLDFWGTWCSPCVAEIPNLKEAYAKFRERGFEVIGMNSDDSLERQKAFVAKKEITWPQATSASIEEFIKDLGITGFPTTVLIQPNGQIYSVSRVGEASLRGKDLQETLTKILPANAANTSSKEQPLAQVRLAVKHVSLGDARVEQFARWARATVHVFSANYSKEILKTQVGQDGEVLSLPPGEYHVSISGASELFKQQTQTITIQPGQKAIDLGVIKLEFQPHKDAPLYVIHGRVLDSAGRPLANVEVDPQWLGKSKLIPNTVEQLSTEYTGPRENPVSATTDTRGEFWHLTEWWPQPLVLFAMNQERTLGKWTVLQGADDLKKELAIRLEPLTQVKLSVQFETFGEARFEEAAKGRPTQSPMVTASTSDGIGSTVRGQDGAAVLHLPAGKYTLDVYGGADRFFEKKELAVTLKPGQGELDLGVIRLAPTLLALSEGKAAPAWHLTEARGISPGVQPAHFKGKWLLVEFFTYNCGPCIGVSLPNLMRIYDEYADLKDHFEILAFHVSLLKDFKALDPYLKSFRERKWKRPLPFPILLDGTDTTAKTWGVTAYPTLVLFDPEGNVAAVNAPGRLEQELKKLRTDKVRASKN